MAELTYAVNDGNGVLRTVTLDIARINPGTRYSSVYDPTETDLLYTHHYIDVQCVWNPFATAAMVNPAGAPPTYIPNARDPNLNLPLLPGEDPMTSLAGLHQLLMTPRGHLIVSNGGITLFESPRNFAVINAGNARPVIPVDAKNGPRPISCEFIGVHGAKSIIVRYVIETWLQEVEPNNTSMLSNRWTVQHVVDADNAMLTTKHVEGLAIFRSDELSILGDLQRVDDFRVKFGHPILPGVMRQNLLVKAEGDGLQIRYSFDDEEKVFNLNPYYGILKIESRFRKEREWNMPNMLPALILGTTLKLWGRKTTSRNQMSRAAMNGLAMFAPFNMALIPWLSYGIDMDMVGRECEAWINTRVTGFGPLGGLASLGFSLLDAFANNNPYPENIGDLGSTATAPNPVPSSSGGMRGTLLERLVTQTLGIAGTAPAAPPASTNAQDIL